MLRPSKDWPGVAFEVDATAVGLTVGAGTPLCVLLLPCNSELLRSAGASSPRRLSGSMMFGSLGKAEVAEDWVWDAPATLTSVAAAAPTSERASTAFQRRFERILSPSVDVGPDAVPPAEPVPLRPRYRDHLSPADG